MTLYDVFMVTQYSQEFIVYTENDYDECSYIGEGSRNELLDEEQCLECIDIINDKVVRILSCKGGKLLIVVKQKHHKRHAIGSFVYSYEMEKECGAYV